MESDLAVYHTAGHDSAVSVTSWSLTQRCIGTAGCDFLVSMTPKCYLVLTVQSECCCGVLTQLVSKLLISSTSRWFRAVNNNRCVLTMSVTRLSLTLWWQCYLWIWLCCVSIKRKLWTSANSPSVVTLFWCFTMSICRWEIIQNQRWKISLDLILFEGYSLTVLCNR